LVLYGLLQLQNKVKSNRALTLNVGRAALVVDEGPSARARAA
jgi:hypothetical protein